MNDYETDVVCGSCGQTFWGTMSMTAEQIREEHREKCRWFIEDQQKKDKRNRKR